MKKIYNRMINLGKHLEFKNIILNICSMLGNIHKEYLEYKHIRPDGTPAPEGLFFMGYIKSLIIPGKADPPKIKGQLIRTLEPQTLAMFSKGTTRSNAGTGRKGHKCIRLEYIRVGDI